MLQGITAQQLLSTRFLHDVICYGQSRHNLCFLQEVFRYYPLLYILTNSSILMLRWVVNVLNALPFMYILLVLHFHCILEFQVVTIFIYKFLLLSEKSLFQNWKEMKECETLSKVFDDYSILPRHLFYTSENEDEYDCVTVCFDWSGGDSGDELFLQ